MTDDYWPKPEIMEPGVKTLWLESLRSGKYTQTTGQLRFNGEHCCLGVLCDILNPQGWSEDDVYVCGSGEGEESATGSLPERLRINAGIPSEAVTLLIEMNDEREMTFAMIAKYIEENL